jgi:hypothetical protein
MPRSIDLYWATFLRIAGFLDVLYLFIAGIAEEHNYALPATALPASIVKAATLAEGQRLALDLVKASLRPSSRVRYRQGWKKWLDFCASSGLSPLAATSDHVTACLALVASSSESVSSVEAVYASISHEYRSRNLPPPTSGPVVGLLMRGIRARFGKLRRPVSPLTSAMIRRFFDCASELNPADR